MKEQRYSQQRERIYQAVRDSREHPTAQMVYDALREESPKLSLGTVYRDLNQLAEAGELSRIALPDGSCRFDGTLHGHSHIVCERCGAVEDVEVLADRFGGQIERQTGFRWSCAAFAPPAAAMTRPGQPQGNPNGCNIR